MASVINDAVNHTLSRTLITSGVTLLSVLALLALGGPVVRNFSLTMTIGIVVGSYSSIYIAAPIALVLERRKLARQAAPVKRAAAKR
jgi:preprotein translocase subunit SecF